MAASRAVLTKKLQKVTEMRTDSPEMLAALNSLATFYDPRSNTLEARRMLRADLEHNGLLLAQEFVRKFEGVEEQLNEVSRCLRGMSDEAEAARTRVAATGGATRRLLARHSEMTRGREVLVQRQVMLSSFVDRFQLSPTHRHALYHGPIDAPEPSAEAKAAGAACFFGVVAHIEDVRRDCARLLTSQHQRIGLEILQEMARHQTQAFERLFQWTLRGVRALGSLGFGPESVHDAVPTALPRAIHELRARPAFQAACCELLTDIRRTSIAQRFGRALTVGGPGGTPRPIALQSHDPQRYVGDMLAWTHQAVASEVDLLDIVLAQLRASDFERLLGEEATLTATTMDGGGGEKKGDQSSARRRWRSKAVEHICGALAQPLSSRMKEVAMQGMETARGDAKRHSQLIVAHRSFAGSVVASLPGPDLVTTFKLHNVISFYAETSHALFGRAAPEEEMEKEREWTAGGEVGSTAGGNEVGSLIAALRSVADLCASRFRAILRARGDELLQLRGVLKTSLGVSSEVVEATSELTEILDIVSSSMVSSRSSGSGSGSGSGSRSGSGAAVANIEVDAIMAGYVEPLTRSALLSAKGLPASDTAALMINTCSYVQRALAPYDFTAWRVEKLAEELDLWMATLVREHTSVVLSRCAFGAILTAVAAGGRLRDAAGMAPAELQRAMATFYSTLTSLAVPAFDQLQNPRLRVEARTASGVQTVAMYTRIYDAVREPTAGYGGAELRSIMLHTPAQVRTLLG